MVATASSMLDLGTKCPDFSLMDAGSRKLITLKQFDGFPALLVMFICNHCPFVKHIQTQLAAIGRDYSSKGVGIVAINSNDVAKYPDDSPENMAREARKAGYVFPYLFDETQEVAKTFRAACTPDFFVFDRDRRLFYRGQLDDSRPKSDIPVTGADLRTALDAVLSGQAVPYPQRPSLGCNIKWKPGNEPAYFRP